MMNVTVTFNVLEVAHVLALVATHDSSKCWKCNAIVTQLHYGMQRNFDDHWGGGGEASPPSSDGLSREAATC